MSARRPRPVSARRSLAAVLVTALTLLGLGAVTAPAAVAADVPETVSADVLPTVQINGVVWAQTTVGNTVYVTGKFTSARPAGAAPGTNETPRTNILAYDLTTGNLIPSFNASLNSDGQGITSSPDGSRIYVVGNFTQVNGVARYRIAALDARTGALVPGFAPTLDYRVKTVVAVGSTVYIGGAFSVANKVARTRLAAFNAADGSLLPWAPTADAEVFDLVAPGGARVVAAGRFTTLNGAPQYGMGALDPVTGASVPWAATQVVRNAGANAAIYSLATDGTQVYGTGYTYGSGGNLEGSFAADAVTGKVNWVVGCRGDVYSVQPIGGVVYTVGHPHNCSQIGGWPQTEPWTFQRAMATSADSQGSNAGGDFPGYAAPRLLNWWPDLDVGTVTGQNQAAWSVTGNSQYISLAGEFPKVNNIAQQGIVRMALRPIAPKKTGPRYQADFTPQLTSTASGAVRVRWRTTWDPDDRDLEYRVVRDGVTATPISTTTVGSTWWDRPSTGITDTGLAPGSTHTYRVYVYDRDGNSTLSTVSRITVPAADESSAYSKGVLADGANAYWPLGSATSGTSALDWAGFDDLTTDATVTASTDRAIAGDPGTASAFAGTSAVPASSGTLLAGPTTFSVEAWIRTTTTRGGKVVGFGNSRTGASSSYDRHVYLQNDGRLAFGIYSGGTRTITSAKAYNDGAWHHVVATLGASGTALYVDGVRVARDAATTTAQPLNGYWRVGGDQLNGWPNRPTSNAFAGSIDEVAVYPTALPAATVTAHYQAAGGTPTGAVKPTDAYGASVWDAQPDSFWRLEETAGTTAADSGPGGTPGTLQGGAVPGVAGIGSGRAVSLDGVDDTVVSTQAVPAPTQYSEELWFRTTTTRGGKIIGFGSATSGRSGAYDRHVWMTTNGRITFGTWTGQQNLATSPLSYNDGAWHHLVASQGPGGMVLSVDGVAVATNPQTGAQGYTGYWRVGGDATWGGTTSDWFAGTVDEVAIYPTALSAAVVRDHFVKGGGTFPNQAPTAAWTSTAQGLVAAFDASTSADADGTVASYAWTFGDQTSGTGQKPSHTYAAAGTYPVTLTVTDDKGATATLTKDVTVAAPPNQAPTAAFTSTAANLVAAFDASTSADADGTVASYAWTFGDQTTGTGATPSHTYAAAGTYPVTLTVTDDDGATGTVTRDVTVTAAAVNQAPTAAFTSTAANLVAAFDASTSADADGTVASYAWTFGDQTSGTGATPSHTYAAAGTYPVTLTVTDDDGATGTVTRDVTVTAAAV
ncbi:PKD domain-containing protein, partial [Kineococcus sp. R8]|uniref:PKD domain-containing protein n=1 Tax=Kineococcus siccus TaxID=2696567 RepID=UPI001411E622